MFPSEKQSLSEIGGWVSIVCKSISTPRLKIITSNDFSSSDWASTCAKDACATDKVANKEHLWKTRVADLKQWSIISTFFLQVKFSSTPYSGI